MKKILITGASGFIGSFMVEEALNRSFETWAGIRHSSSKRYLQDEGIRFIDLNYSNVEALTKQLADFRQEHGRFDYIIHNAGVTKTSDKRDFDRVNCDYTRNFVLALQAADMVPDKFVYMSSLSAFGSGDEKTLAPIMLSDEPQPNTVYGESKLKAERFLQGLSDFPFIILRPTGVYGPRETDYFVFNQTVSRGIEPSMGFKPQYLSFIYVADLIWVVFAALESSIVRRDYFVAEGRIYTNDEYAGIVKKILGRKCTLKLKVPLFLVRAVAHVLDTVYGWAGKSPTLNNDKYRILSATNWKCDITPLERDFGFKAQYDLERGMKASIDWYRKEKWLK